MTINQKRWRERESGKNFHNIRLFEYITRAKKKKKQIQKEFSVTVCGTYISFHDDVIIDSLSLFFF